MESLKDEDKVEFDEGNWSEMKSESEYLGETPFWKMHHGKRASKFKFIWAAYQLEDCERVLVKIDDAPK